MIDWKVARKHKKNQVSVHFLSNLIQMHVSFNEYQIFAPISILLLLLLLNLFIFLESFLEPKILESFDDFVHNDAVNKYQ